VRFVMDTCFYTLPDGIFERMGFDFSVGFRNDNGFHKLDSRNPEVVTFEPTDYINPMFKYMRPILDSNGQPVCRQPGVNAYWVAKEDIPKFEDALNGTFRSSAESILHCPQLVTNNGQLTALLDTTSKPLVTNSVFDPAKSEFLPTVREFREGQTISSFSLLSWDGRTVSSDFYIEFATIGGSDKMADILQGVPNMNSIMFSEKGLVYPADGMLVVHIVGPTRYREGRIEAGVPIFNKIPYLQRVFINKAIARDVLTAQGILTIRMLAPNEEPRTAVVPRTIQR